MCVHGVRCARGLLAAGWCVRACVCLAVSGACMHTRLVKATERPSFSLPWLPLPLADCAWAGVKTGRVCGSGRVERGLKARAGCRRVVVPLDCVASPACRTYAAQRPGRFFFVAPPPPPPPAMPGLLLSPGHYIPFDVIPSQAGLLSSLFYFIFALFFFLRMCEYARAYRASIRLCVCVRACVRPTYPVIW